MFISSSHARLQALTGWRALLACYVAGAVMTLGFAPFHAWPVIFISLPVFCWVLGGATNTMRAVWRGFFFGYGYFMAGTWWIANSMLVDVAKFGWLIPVSVLGLSAVFAVCFGVFGAVMYRLRHPDRLTHLLRFALVWVAMEYGRSLGIFGFPWNLAGYMALASLPVAQMASVIGTYGLSFFVVLVGLTPVLLSSRSCAWISGRTELLLRDIPAQGRDAALKGRDCRNRWIWLALPVLIIGGFYAFGVMRLPRDTALTTTKIRVVQPNIAQTMKWTPQGKMDSLRIHADLTRARGAVPDIVVWSETAFPFALREGSPWPARLAGLLPPHGLLLTGVVRAEDGPPLRLWNSLVAIDALGAVRATYGKHQLVPFGEFVPLRMVLPLDKITPGDVDFSRGEGATTVAIDALPTFSPLVCYEVIFPWIAVDAAHRPEWIVNVTNDGWYGNAPGPYQHFDMARMRAIEQGLPLVRAANTGISAVIDPYGRVTAKLGIGARGVVDAMLPKALAPTMYAQFGEIGMLLFAALSVIFLFFRQHAIKNK